MTYKNKGASFDSFLEEENIFDEVEAVAVKRVIAFQLANAMKKQKLTKNKLAMAMKTSGASLDRLLDPENTSVTLQTLVRASHVLGQRISFTINNE